ncbi:hypothetical protein [Streptomyces sp. NPDC051183]|uniref:sulfotransferase-like domain-containing protein n=1 Tax=unclassified Streptomyces TaxID=2593676 RepID=UPI00343C7735
MAQERRIAVWSGPRALSTVLARAWESRSDTAVADEPFFGYYITRRGPTRPGRERFMPHDWPTIVRCLEGPIPDGKAIWYQKHHALHLSSEVPREWMDRVTNCFLIRDPRLVVRSYSRIRTCFTAADLGYAQLAELFDHIRARTGSTPLVVDAGDLARHPATYLQAMCASLEVDFDERMLRWPAGRRTTDPELGDPWYVSVQNSTGFFSQADPADVQVPRKYAAIVDECSRHYQRLSAYRLERR